MAFTMNSHTVNLLEVLFLKKFQMRQRIYGVSSVNPREVTEFVNMKLAWMLSLIAFVSLMNSLDDSMCL